MDLIVGKKELEAALKAVKPSVSTGQHALASLKGVRLHAGHAGLTLTATDLELAIIRRAPATVNDPGKCLLPFKALLQAVSAMQGETIQIVLEKEQEGQASKPVTYTAGQAKIISGARTVTMRTLPLEDFPNITGPDPTAISEWFVTDAGTLAETFRAVTIAASHDEARPILTGICMNAKTDGLWSVCTDSYRLAYRRMDVLRHGDGEVTTPGRRIIPSRVGQIFAAQQGKRKHPSNVVARSGKLQASFEVEETCYVTRLIDGEFPNWRQLIPTNNPITAEFFSDELESAVKGVAVFAQAGWVKLEMVPSMADVSRLVRIVAGSQDEGECSEELAGVASVEGLESRATFGFNAGYLLDALKFIGADTVHMYGRDGLRPFLWANGNVEESAYLLMPVRI